MDYVKNVECVWSSVLWVVLDIINITVQQHTYGWQKRKRKKVTTTAPQKKMWKNTHNNYDYPFRARY